MLTNGNHKLIAEWQLKESLRRTFLRRPDMLESVEMTPEMLKLLEKLNKKSKNKGTFKKILFTAYFVCGKLIW